MAESNIKDIDSGIELTKNNKTEVNINFITYNNKN